MKKIKIACKGADLLSLSSFREFQGELKTLTESAYKKLRREILERGFSFPILIWKNEGQALIIDGHQRIRTLQQMETEGHKIPKIPVVYVEASSEKEARLKILSGASQYGRVDRQGLYEFMHQSDIDIEELTKGMELPSVDAELFAAEYFQETVARDSQEDPAIPPPDTSLREPPSPSAVPETAETPPTPEGSDESTAKIHYLPTVEDTPSKPSEPRAPKAPDDKTKITYEFLPEEKQELMAFSDDLMKKWKLDSHAAVIHHAIIEAHKKACRKK